MRKIYFYVLYFITLHLSISLNAQNFYTWEQLNGPYTGFVTDVEVITKDSQEYLFAGTDGAGLFRSSDNGITWESNWETDGNVSRVDKITMTPLNSIIMSSSGSGIYRSTDIGNSWQQVYTFIYNCEAIAINKEGHIFVGTWNGVYRSTNDGLTWGQINNLKTKCITITSNEYIFVGTESNGIYRSTDKGDTWEFVSPGLSPIVALIALPSDRVLAALWDNQGGRIYASDDFGGEWIKKDYNLGHVSRLFMDTSNGRIYAGNWEGTYYSDNLGESWNQFTLNEFAATTSITVNSNGQIFVGTEGGIFSTTDNGITWSNLNYGLNASIIPSIVVSYNNNVFAATYGGGIYKYQKISNEWISSNGGLMLNVSYLALGRDGIFAMANRNVYKSDDDGNSWINVLSFGVDYLASSPDGNLFTRSPNNSNDVIKISEDNGSTWRDFDNGFLSQQSLKSTCMLPYNDSIFFLGTNSGLYYTKDKGNLWQKNSLNLTGVNKIIKLPNGNIFLSDNSPQRQIFKSTDKGESWSTFQGPPYFMDVFTIDNKGHIYMGAYLNNIYKSKDNGNTWTELKLTTIGHERHTYSLAADQEGNIYVGSFGYGVFRYSPSTNSLKLTSPNGGEIWQSGMVKTIEWLNNGVNNAKLHYTTNGGTNWIYITTVSASNGIYNWTVPNITSNNCKIKITDQLDSEVADTTDGIFRISSIPLISGTGEYFPDDNTVLLLHMNETNGTTLFDESNYNNDGSATGTTIVNGRFIKARKFNGASDYISVISLADDPNKAFTLEAWIYIEEFPELGQKGTIMAMGDTPGTVSPAIWLTDDQKIWFYMYVDGSHYFDLYSETILQKHKWYHIAGIYTEQEMKIYINGIQDVAVAYDFGSQDRNNFYIGANGNYNEHFLNGVVDEIRISKIVRSPQEFNLQLPPTNLITQVSGTNINISWQNGGGAISFMRYRIYRGNDSANVALIDSTTNLVYQNVGLTSGTYYYRISGVDSTGFEGVKSYAVSAEISTKTILLTSPNGSENWKAGTQQNIIWISSNITNIKIEYSTNNGTNWNNIIMSTPANAGSYIWTVPNTPSINCKIRVSDASNSLVNDISDNVFTIYTPTISVTSPNGGETWQVGSTHNITWSYQGIENIKIEYSTDNGANWQEIISQISTSTGSYDWVVPGTPSAYCKVRMSDTADNSIKDESDFVFTITETSPPSVTVLSPNGGEHWQTGTTQNINWDSYEVQNVKIELTIDNGSGWQEIISSTPSDGTYEWVVENKPSTNCKIRISDATAFPINDISSNTFTILPLTPDVPTLVSPTNNAEQIPLTTSLVWNSVSGADSYDIQVSTDNSFSSTVVNEIGITDLSKQITGLEINTKYFWHVRAVNSGGTSGYSETWSFNTINPTITITSPISTDECMAGRVYTIKWTSNLVNDVKIEFSSDNGVNWKEEVSSISASSGSYNWTVPSSSSTECRIRITDVTYSTVSNVSDAFTIFTYPTQLTINNNISFPEMKQNSYRMVGLPGNVDIPISQCITGVAGTDWNAFYDNGNTSENPENYKVKYDGSGNFNFKPGRGFWIISKNGFSISQTASAVAISTDNTYSIPLHREWNIISNPFEKRVAWSKIQSLNNSIPDPIHDFQGSYSSSSSFDPYIGYYFFNRNNLGSLKILYNPSGSLGKENFAKSSGSNNNSITISLLKNNEAKSSIIVGIDQKAKNTLDDLDQFAPPGDFDDYRIYLKNENLETSYKYLSEEFRNDSSDGQQYNLRIKSPNGQEIYLVADGLYSFEDKEIYFVDRTLAKFYNLKLNSTVKINQTKDRDYFVLLGDEEFINAKREELQPKYFYLYQNYPNPFNPVTTLRYSLPQDSNVRLTVYNTVGETVTELIDVVQGAGYYEVKFDASSLSSGIYFYEMMASNPTSLKLEYRHVGKMVLIK